MAQQEKALATQPDNLKLFPSVLRGKQREPGSHRLFSDL